MTPDQKLLFTDLLNPKCFVRKRGNVSAGLSFALYSGNMVLIRKVRVSKELRKVLIKNRKDQLFLCRSEVRKLHGKSWMKKEYKNYIQKTKHEKLHNTK